MQLSLSLSLFYFSPPLLLLPSFLLSSSQIESVPSSHSISILEC